MERPMMEEFQMAHFHFSLQSLNEGKPWFSHNYKIRNPVHCDAKTFRHIQIISINTRWKFPIKAVEKLSQCEFNSCYSKCNGRTTSSSCAERIPGPSLLPKH